MSAALPDLTWEDPPAKGVGDRRGPWRDLADKLKEQPGRWALVVIGDKEKVNRGNVGLRAWGVECAIRTVDDEHRLYARWPEGQS